MAMSKSSSQRFWIVLVALLVGGGIINAWERAGEASVSRRPLKDFPSQLGSWQQRGSDSRFDDETEKVLRADDYVSRNYESADGLVASFYVGYYASERTGST